MADVVLPGRATFELEEYHWEPPDRLELSGRWRGLEPLDLHEPVLVVVTTADAQELTPLPPSSVHAGARADRWRVAFRYEGDPAAILRAELRPAPGAAVMLPPPPPRRRFGRRVLEVRRVEAPAIGPHGPPARLPAAAVGDDELTGARREAASARAEAERLRHEAERLKRQAARQQAQHAARSRRAASQLQEALATNEELAAELDGERVARAAAASETERLRGALAALTEAHEQLRARTRSAVGEHVAAGASQDRARRHEAAEVERLSAALRDLRAEMERLAVDHRATLRYLADRISPALHRIGTVTESSGDQAVAARRRLDDRTSTDEGEIRQRLDAIAEESREATGLARTARRDVERSVRGT